MAVFKEAFVLSTGVPLPIELENDISGYLPWVRTPSASSVAIHFHFTPVDFDKIPISNCTIIKVPINLQPWRLTIEYSDWRRGLLAKDRGCESYKNWLSERFGVTHGPNRRL